MKPLTKALVLVVTASLVLVGCAQQATPTQSTDFAATLQVMQTQIANNPTQAAPVAATAQPTDAPTVAPTNTPEPTTLPTDTPAVATTVVVPVTAAYGPSFRVGDVVDLNYPDGTYVNAGMTIKKIWKVKNVGTATWPADTKIIAADDNPFGLADDATIGQVVSNGQSVEIHVTLKAPGTVANYKAKFMLETPDGKKFGIGDNFDQPFWNLLYVR